VSDALLDRLASDTGGAVETIYPGERLDDKVAAQFSRAIGPRVSDVHLVWEGVEVSDLAPAKLPDLVDGDIWSVFGRYETSGIGHASFGARLGKPFALRFRWRLPRATNACTFPRNGRTVGSRIGRKPILRVGAPQATTSAL
jgi:Ca-activated chloride channel family protein